MFGRVLASVVVISAASAIPAQVQLSDRNAPVVQFSNACAQGDGGDGCSPKPNTYCGSLVNKFAAW